MAEAKTQKFNRGDAAEGILGAALAAKFAKRPKAIGQAFPKITISDIDDMLDDFFSTGQRVITSVGDIIAAKGKSKVRDNIILGIGLPEKAMQLLKKRENRKEVHDLYESAIAYVEDTWIKEVEMFAINSNPDRIEILSDGIGDQKGTKADIKISINGKPYSRQISLKVSGGDQFAQVSGHEFSKQIKIWNDMFGLDIRKMEAKYNKTIKNYDSSKMFSSRDNKVLKAMRDMVKSAASEVYKEAASQLSKKMTQDKYLEKFANIILTGATKGETSVELVKLDKQYKQMRFDKGFVGRYAKDLKKQKIIVTYRSKNDKGEPVAYVEFYAGSSNKTSNLILTVRLKVENQSKSTSKGKMYSPYTRNLILAGPKMFGMG